MKLSQWPIIIILTYVEYDERYDALNHTRYTFGYGLYILQMIYFHILYAT